MSPDRRITVSARSLARSETVPAYASPAATARQVLEATFPYRRFTRFAIDGVECKPDTSIGQATHVAGWEMPAGLEPATWALIGKIALYVAVSAAVSAVGYFVNKRAMAKMGKYKKSDEETSDTNYGWDYDASNAEQEGAPVPVLYGRRLVIPPVASQRVHDVNETRQSFLDCTYAVADGGAGFSDVIAYESEGDSKFYARVDHTPWENLNKGTTSASAGDNWRTFAAIYGEIFTSVPKSSWQSGTFSGGDRRDKLTDGDLNEEDEFKTGDLYLHFSRPISIDKVVMYTRCKKDRYFWGNFTLEGLDNIGEGQTARWTSISGASAWYWADADRKAIFPSGKEIIIVTHFTANGTDTVKRQHYRIHRKSIMKVNKIDRSNVNQMVKASGAGASEAKCHVTEVRVGGAYTDAGSAVGGGYIALEATAGRFDETPTTFQTGTWSGLNVSKYLETEWFAFATTPVAYPDHASIRLAFPYGCYKIDDETGDLVNSYATVSAEYRAVSADGTFGPWTNFFISSHADTGINYNNDGSITIGLSTQNAIHLTFQRDGVGNGAARLEVRVKRSDVPADSSMEQNTCQWEILEEGWAFVPAYPRTATAVVQMNASEKFNGRLPQFSILARRSTVYVWNPIQGAWEEHAADNPAWAAYDLIVRPRFDDINHDSPDESGALLRETFPHDKMLYGEFAAWSEFCDDNGIVCAMYYDAQSTMEKGVQYLCDIGRAQLVLKGGRIGVAVDKRADLDASGSPVPVFTFDDSNIVAESWSVQFRDRADLPTEYEVTFFDRDREWNRFTVVSRDPELDNEATAQNVQSVTLYACDRRDVAQAFAEYAIRQNMVSRTYAWSGGLSAMPVEIGDIVSLKGDLVRVTAVSVEEDFTRKYEGVEYVDARFA
ncbi:MAG: phage tail protein [Victivallales bacterium]|nr:phage tail protein [Victivallales bacterium]